MALALKKTSLAIKFVLFTLQVTFGTGISTRDPATEWPSCFVRRCVVLLHSESFVQKVSVNVRFGEGKVGSFPETYIDPSYV